MPVSLFKEASKLKKRFKISAYGGPGCGKTLFGLSFPKPAIIDMEHGTDWYAGRIIVPELGCSKDFKVEHTDSADRVKEVIGELEKLLVKEPGYVESIVIDPITLLWEAIQDAFMKRLKKKYGEEAQVQFRHWREIKSPYRQLMTKLLNLPVHMVLLGREAALYEHKGKELVQIGTKIATEKDTPYVSDIHLRLFTKPHPESKEDCFFAQVEKDRTHLLKKGSIIKNCCYKKLAELAEEKTPGEYSEPTEASNEKAVDRDQKLFDDEDSKDHASLIEDGDIKKLWTELDWTPGKVGAMIAKNDLTTREALGKFLADEVRKRRSTDE